MRESIYLLNLYSTPSRWLFKGTPTPGSVKEESLEECVKGTRKVPWQRIEVRGETIPIEKALFYLVTVQASGTTKSPLDAEQRDRRPELVEVRMKNCKR